MKKRTPVASTLDWAITRIHWEEYDFDCQLVKQVKAFIGTTAHTEGLQGTVSLIVLENEMRISKYLEEIKDFFSQ